jgi:serine/threonine-protein kinase
VYIRGTTEVAKRTLVWVDRQGREETIPVEPRAYAYARLSPDETRIALDVRDQDNDIWILDVARTTMTRLTLDPGVNRGPLWVPPDGPRVAFSVARDGAENVYWQAADGSSPAEALTNERPNPIVPRAISPDGAWLVLSPATPPFDLRKLALNGDRRIEPLLATSYDEHAAEISPDGRWMAYQSNESGRYEVYVRPFPNVNDARIQISRQGGSRPLWSRDGRELFFSATTATGGSVATEAGTILSAPISPGPAFSHGDPTVVVKGPYIAPQTGRHFDVSKSGRFLMIKNAPPSNADDPPEIVVVQHWIEELKRMVAVN